MITAPRVLLEGSGIQNQRIGVVRAYEGGAAERGRAASAQAIMSGADEIAGFAFKYAAENAQEQATEMAQAASVSDVMAIDPATGAPVAMSRMDGMGRIGSEAYRRVINARFQQNIEEEIRNRAAVLAEQYGDNPDGIGLYTTAMSDYISSMSENATGQWRGMIEEFGTSYINRTRASMTVAQMRRSRASMAAASRAAATEAISSMQASVAQLGPAAFGIAGPQASGFVAPSFPTGVEPTVSGSEYPVGRPVSEASAAAIAAGTNAPLSYGDIGIAGAISFDASRGIADAIEADVIRAPDMSGWNRAQRMAVLSGMTDYYVNNMDVTNPEAVTQLALLRSTIGSRDIMGAMRLAPELAPYMEFLLGDADAVGDYDTFANKSLIDAEARAQILSEPVRLEREARTQELALQWAQQDQVAAYETRADVRNVVVNEVGNLPFAMNQLLAEINETRAAIPGERNETRREAMQNRVESAVASIQQGLFEGLIADGMNQDEIDRLRSLFANGSVNQMSMRERIIYNEALKLRPYNPEILDDFDSEFGSYRESARYNQFISEQEGEAVLNQDVLPYVQQIEMMLGENVALGAAELRSRVGELTLDDGARNRAETQIYTAETRGEMANAFSAANTAEELRALRFYAEGTAGPEGLPADAVAAIDRARVSAGLTNNTSAYGTALSGAFESRNRILTERDRVIEQNQGIRTVVSGSGDATRSQDRASAQLAFEREFQAIRMRQLDAFGGPADNAPITVPEDFWRNPSYMQDPALAPLFNRAYNTHGFMPESLMTEFQALASGAITPGSEAVLAHWNQMRLNNYNGTFIRNTAINALSEDDIGRLNMMSSAIPMFGSERVAEFVAAANQLAYSPDANTRIEQYLGGPMADFMATVDGYSALSLDQRQAVDSLAQFYAAMSVANPNIPTRQSQIRSMLEEQLAQAAPDSNGLVRSYDSNGMMTTRSEFALERTVPQYQSEFVDYIRSDAAIVTGINLNLETSTFVEGNVWLGQRDGDVRHFLVPYGRDAAGGVSYYVYQLDPNTSMVTAVSRTDPGFEGIPYMVSTSESGFRAPLNAQAARERAQHEANLRSEEAIFQNAYDPSLEGLELMGIR